MIISGTITTENYEAVHEDIRRSVWDFYGDNTDYDLLEFEVRDVSKYVTERNVPGVVETYRISRVYEVDWKAKVR